MEFTYASLDDWNTLASSAQAPAALALTTNTDGSLGDIAKDMDVKSDGLLRKAIASARFEGKAGQIISVLAPSNMNIERIYLLGLGGNEDVTDLSYEQAAGEAEAHALYGAKLASYYFGKYFTKKKEHELPSLNQVIVAGHAEGAEAYHGRLDALATGIALTRDVVSEPANIINPESLAELCNGLSRGGLDVDVLGEKRMQKLGMHALLGVGQGSTKESHLVVMRWNGADDKKDAPVAFVGKGVCFDSGGISIKPSNGMEEMKWDMGGSGTVIGLMRTLAERKAKVNAVGVVGLVENMPDGNAQRPGDVVTSMSGQTIEVLNTDAEGRLVLADALWYTQQEFKPKFMVDLATLTGAIVVGLGSKYAGLFSNDDTLAERIAGLGKTTGDEAWRMPLDDFYDKQINSQIADMQNIGTDREAGSITAAQFLQRFVNDVPWAHLDIAAVAWTKKGNATTPKGATGYGVRLLDALVETYYEA